MPEASVQLPDLTGFLILSCAPAALGLRCAETTSSDDDTQVILLCASPEDRDPGFEGTSWSPNLHAFADICLCHAEMTTSDEDTQLNLFCAFLEDQDRGFEGTFADWTKTVLAGREEAFPLLDWFELDVPDEDVSLILPKGLLHPRGYLLPCRRARFIGIPHIEWGCPNPIPRSTQNRPLCFCGVPSTKSRCYANQMKHHRNKIPPLTVLGNREGAYLLLDRFQLEVLDEEVSLLLNQISMLCLRAWAAGLSRHASG